MSNLSEQIAKSLGSENSYAVFTTDFDESLLNPIPRESLREENGVDSTNFTSGWDIWHCWESTFLLNSGLPIAGTTKIWIPSTTDYIPESKSMKLFFNSFDMCTMGENRYEATSNYVDTISSSLNKLLFKDIPVNPKDRVRIKFFPYSELVRINDQATLDIYNHQPLEELIDKDVLDKTSFSNYQGGEELVFEETEEKTQVIKIRTNILRSRCRHTKQKDTGNIYLELLPIDGYKLDLVSLLKLIVSYRELNEFHEMCCEKMFSDILKTGLVKHLTIQLLYSRRGSLDIDPIRANHPNMDDKFLKGLVYPFLLKEMNQ